MKQFKSNLRLGLACLLSSFAIFVSVAGAQAAQNPSETGVLARVEVTGELNQLGLPVYAHLLGCCRAGLCVGDDFGVGVK